LKRFKVMLTDKIDRAGLEILEEVADLKFASSPSEEVLAREVKDVDGMVVRVPAVITRRILENADRLRVIARFGVGYDNIDVAAATERGVVVTYTPGANTQSVAEYAAALMFALTKQIVQADRALREHRWAMRLDYSGIELADKTLGLIGTGAIGCELARIARGLQMEVVGYDIFPNQKRADEIGFKYADLDSLLKQSDVVSIHVPLNPDTKKMFGKTQIALMKDGAFFINTARGELVDENDLYEALRDGKLAGAGLDVFEKEPPYDSPLLTLPNVVAGPHVAALAKDANRRVSVWVAEDIVRVLKHERPLHPVNPQVLDKEK
jgi:D-3-phosphoglycerate dehydrogenase